MRPQNDPASLERQMHYLREAGADRAPAVSMCGSKMHQRIEICGAAGAVYHSSSDHHATASRAALTLTPIPHTSADAGYASVAELSMPIPCHGHEKSHGIVEYGRSVHGSLSITVWVRLPILTEYIAGAELLPKTNKA